MNTQSHFTDGSNHGFIACLLRNLLRVFLLADVDSKSQFESKWFFPLDIALWVAKLHDLSPFAAYWVVGKSFPFETIFLERSLKVGISSHFASLLIFDVDDFCSNMVTGDFLPNVGAQLFEST